MKKLNIFLIEDDGDDIELLKEAFEMNKVDCQVEVVTEGDKVIPVLSDGATKPDVIVMDLNLPKLHGREILALIKASVKLSSIPIVVLTTSSLQDDIDFAYSMGAKQFITKPNTIDGFNSAVRTIVSVTQ
jgi:CheY-like chemotaxis protein